MDFTNDFLEAEDWYKQPLEHFGIEHIDCSFEVLKTCAEHLKAEKPEQGVKRWHDPIIQSLVKQGDSLIDLGCGSGELLARLAYSTNCWIQGVEKDEGLVSDCIERGLPVCHAEILDILNLLPDKNYTWAVLEDTVQTLTEPITAIEQSLRIAENAIITFPNFAHWSVRFTFSLGGRMPVTKSLPHTWYNTPNIHLCSITDFLVWCKQAGVTITDAYALVEGNPVKFEQGRGHNITAEQAMFIIRK